MASRPRVLVCHPLPEAALSRISAHVEIVTPGSPPAEEEFGKALASSHGVLCLLVDPIRAQALRAAPRLRIVSSVSVGVDHIDVAAATALGIPVGHTPSVLAETTADLTFALLLAAARRANSRDPRRYSEPGTVAGRPAARNLHAMSSAADQPAASLHSATAATCDILL